MAVSIYTFLSDQYQHQLKGQAQTGSDRFEQVMKNYKKLFWAEFNSLLNTNLCPDLNARLKNLSAPDKKNLFDWLDALKQTIATNTTPLNAFFDSLIDIYETYIRGNITLASTNFNTLLSTNRLYSSATDYERYYPVAFRGRYAKSSPSLFCKPKPVTKDFFYHIPFDQLYCIKNYRFSITGSPMIYLGASLPTVILELRSDLDKFGNLELSTWAVKPGVKLKMYDISNELYDLINLNIIAIIAGGGRIDATNTGYGANTPNVSTFVNDFQKFIISQFCTFKKEEIKGQVFIEQYVLPQLFTEQIRNYTGTKYDGFIFPSTQYLDKATSTNNEIYYSLFKYNIALFTTYQPSDKYDTTLIDKFEVIPIDKKKFIDKDAFIKGCDAIPFDLTRIDIGKIKIQVKLLEQYYSKMAVDGIPLTDLKSIKIQFASMLEYIQTL